MLTGQSKIAREVLDAAARIIKLVVMTDEIDRVVHEATNIAKTSLTLEGIVYVVDKEFSKQWFYNPLIILLFVLKRYNNESCNDYFLFGL
ncbi:pre-mRNA-splicing factor ATP-dependent RNA helicase DEAH1-like [Vigna radiata var. radiata]|uniref:Pre-mRNA-splicing factor ATP-dependent RNA helicase DEAH1-like n=1 Tax=Vigna radiata var. radiata TaxID=3916 RepID=A0A3Q0FFC2_VIGRR|nr:pre-mRNA-splicing factor ATP-dependent RNA helicase DEAH1-like [Vigna radiata var. radiata]